MTVSSQLSPLAAYSDFGEFVAAARSLIEAELDRLLPQEQVAPTRVHAAMRWSVFAGGKRFRPLLLLTTGETFGASTESLISAASAMEMIHTYSLIHDDLPSMDNDKLRRGVPTCHLQFDEATAILAGDALQALAFETISGDERISAETRARLANELGRAAGSPAGMVAGQAYDLAAESTTVTGEQLEQIHRLKTGALIIASARCGAIIAKACDSELATITDYAAQLGLLFQITDDLLDVTSTAEALGKTPGKDARSQKATYPALYGLEAAHARAAEVHQKARATLSKLHQPTERLLAIADYIFNRRT